MGDDDDQSATRLPPRPVIYKSSALAATAPNLVNKSYDGSACIAAAAATAEEVRRRFKEGQVDSKGQPIPVVSGEGEAADAQRHKRRVALNRNSAASSRVRKEAYVSALESQLYNLEKSYNLLFKLINTDKAGQLARSDHDASAAAVTPVQADDIEPIAGEVAAPTAAPVETPIPIASGASQLVPTAVPQGDPPKVEETDTAVIIPEVGKLDGAIQPLDHALIQQGTKASVPGESTNPVPPDALSASLFSDFPGIQLLPELAAMDPSLAQDLTRITESEDPAVLRESETEPLADLLQAYNAFDPDFGL